MKNSTKIIGLSALGSCFELFDFLSFIFLSSILAQVFFPQQSADNALIYTLIIFSISYFFRPIGGIILAHFGDRYGRKRIFVITLLLMALPSLCIAFLPTPQHIGFLSPLLLLILRGLQGVSAGGEVAGAMTYVAEMVPQQWRILACSFVTAAANLGVLLSTLLITLLTRYCTQQQMLDYGWRIPFLLGSLLGLLAFYLRKRCCETPLFVALENENRCSRLPILDVFKQHKRSALIGISLALIASISTSTFHLYFPTYLVNFLHYPLAGVMQVSSLGVAILALTSPLFALSATYWGWHKQCLMGLIALLFLCVYASLRINSTTNFLQIYCFIILFSLSISSINSIFFGLMANFFPTRARYTGVAVAYNLGCLIAGLTPMINTWLINRSGYLQIPFLYVCIFDVIALLLFSLSTRQKMLSC